MKGRRSSRVVLEHTAAAPHAIVRELCAVWAHSFLGARGEVAASGDIGRGIFCLLRRYDEITLVWGQPGRAMDFGTWTADDAFAPIVRTLPPGSDGRIEMQGDLPLAYLERRRVEFLQREFRDPDEPDVVVVPYLG